MFDLSWSEMLVILAVAVVVIGPQDMPRTLYAAGKFFRKIRGFTSDLRASLDRVMLEEELRDITREANKAGEDSMAREVAIQAEKELDRKEQQL